MRALVTGGTGDLGRRVVARLADRGHEVVVATRRPGGPDQVAYDLEAPPPLDGIDVVLHLASDPINPSRDVAAMERLLAAATDARLPHLVFVSIVGIDGHPLPYYRAKVDQERLLAEADLPWTVLRATQFHSFVPRIALMLTRGPFTIVPRGYRIQPIDPDEVARRLADLVETGPSGRTTDIGGPQVVDVAEALAGYARSSDRRLRILRVPVPGALGRAFAEGANLLGPEGEVIGISYDEFVATRT